MPKSSNKVKITSNVLLDPIVASSPKYLQPNKDVATKYREQTVEVSPMEVQENIEIVTIDKQYNEMSSTETPDTVEMTNENAEHYTEISTMNKDTVQDVDSNINLCSAHPDELISYLTTEHNKLYEENKKLKENLNNFSKYHENVEHRFAMIQVRLDNITRLLERKPVQDPVHADLNSEDEIMCTDLKFPIESIKDLETLEERLQDKNLENKLVKKLSKLSGTDGLQKLHKIGISLLSQIIKDECLSLCSWKGIKGCDKIPFVNFFNVREMIYKIVSLADKKCSLKEVDEFLQHSAIKHCNQRLKRKMSKFLSPKPTSSKSGHKHNPNANIVPGEKSASEIVISRSEESAAEVDVHNEKSADEVNVHNEKSAAEIDVHDEKSAAEVDIHSEKST